MPPKFKPNIKQELKNNNNKTPLIEVQFWYTGSLSCQQAIDLGSMWHYFSDFNAMDYLGNTSPNTE